MREATGSSMLLYIVVFFAGIVILFFAGILTYSKAYKAKNRIIEVIEEYGTYNTNTKEVISSSLKYMGYQIGECPQNQNFGSKYSLVSTGEGYKYCVYYSSYEKIYKVITYVHFDFPIIGNSINIGVAGETKVLGKNYDYE